MQQLNEQLQAAKSKIEEYEQHEQEQNKTIAQLRKYNEDLLSQFNQSEEKYQNAKAELYDRDTQLAQLNEYADSLKEQIVSLELDQVCMKESMSQKDT